MAIKKLPPTITSALRVRKAATEDLSFILDSWLKDYKRSAYAGVVPNNLYDKVYSNTIQQLLDRGMTVLVAEGTQVNTLIGYIAFEASRSGAGVVHWLYVKKPYRGNGFGCYLLQAAGIDPAKPYFYTFRTRASKKFLSGRFVPALARRKDLEPVTIAPPQKANNED